MHAPRHSTGFPVSPPTVDMAQVKRYVAAAIGQVYEYETPDTFENAGVEVIHASAQFLDAETIRTGDRIVKAQSVLDHDRRPSDRAAHSGLG